MASISVHHGDCLKVLPRLPREHFDAVVTDPPYHLTSIVKRFGGASAAPAQFGTDGAFARASRGFMGQTWDGGDIAMRPETWAAVYDTLKPGGHMVVFGGTRTFHRMAVAIEDAGFELRDTLMWLYGTGFPKSHDVSKGIDKAGGGEGMPMNDRREFALELRTKREAAGISRTALAAWYPAYSEVTKNWERLDAGFRVPSEIDYQMLVERLGVSEKWRLRVRAEDKRIKISNGAADRRGDGTVYGLAHAGCGYEAATETAKEWAGWGTALKPGWEPVLLVRKPLIGTVAQNVLAHGTGALNIDGCRVPTGDDLNGGAYSPDRKKSESAWVAQGGTIHSFTGRDYVQPQGRWPANVLHDGSDEVTEAFAAFGEKNGGHHPTSRGHGGISVNGHSGQDGLEERHSDSGTAARFFYCAKASKADRAGSSHPTVKPVALLKYLCRLITPPGGMILDPFAGSGTTGQAAREEGFRATLIEREHQYVADIVRRLQQRAA